MRAITVKNVVSLLLAMTLAALIGWQTRGWYERADFARKAGARPGNTQRIVVRRTATAPGSLRAARSRVPPRRTVPPEPLAPPDVLVAIATSTNEMPRIEKVNDLVTTERDPDAPRPIIVPVTGVKPSELRDMFDEGRGDHRHEAIDILAPRGTPVVAADDGVVKKLFTSVPGGLTVYEFDPDERFCYYYAHLDRYADGLHEGQALHRGEVLGYVGTTGNAPENTPHLHFALIRLDPERHWWKGTYVNPYPLLVATTAR